MLSAPDFKHKQIIFAMLSHGEKLSFKNDNIIISNENGIRYQSTCYKLFAVFVVGHITITTGLLQRAKKFGFSIVLMTHGLSPYGQWFAKAEGNVVLRKKQYNYQRFDIAQHIVANKIASQLAMLRRRRNKSSELKQAIKRLNNYLKRLPEQTLTLQDILGIEGIASRVYFPQMFDEMNWQRRRPRVKQDITNLLLDIGYTQLFNIVEALLNLYGFDVYQGVYHQTFYQRKSLVCDLVEPLRPIVDQAIRNAYKLGQINPNDFTFVQNQYRIIGKPAQPYIALLLKAILAHKDAIFLYIQSYYRAFMQDKPILEYPWFEIKE
jgi:CRISPR-associated protein Cas1